MQQSIISEQDKTRLRRTFRKDLKRQVHLRLFTQRQSLLTIPGRECPYCPQTESLMEELAGLTPKIELETIDFYGQPDVAREQGVTRIPAIVLSPDGSARVKFYGAPMGYERATIVEDIKTISRGVSPLTMDTRKKLRRLNQDVHIQVFVTPTCTFCPGMARLAHAVALESPRVSSDVIEIQEFPALGQAYGVRSVPLTVINEHIRFTGAVTEVQFIERVVEAGVRNSG